MKSSRIKNIILLTITVTLIFFFLIYIYKNSDKYLELLQLSTPGILSIFILSLVFPVISGWITTSLFRGLGVEISYKNGFLINAASTLANQLPISGGIISRGYYLKRKYNLSYTKYLSATMALFLCFIGANGLLGLLILLYPIVISMTVIPNALLIGYISMVACLLVFWLPIDKIRAPDRIRKLLNQAVEGWMLIGRNPGLLATLITLQTSLVISMAIRYCETSTWQSGAENFWP